MLVNVLATSIAVALIVLMIIIYFRSRQGDRRVIMISNQMLLPFLSAMVITLTIIFANRPATPMCSGPLALIGYIGLFATILLVAIGVLRFFTSPRRDIRIAMHPILFAIIVVTAAFLVEYLNGCL